MEKKETKIISSVILKMYENNQYGQGITKALPYGCIKLKEHPPPPPHPPDLM